MKLCAVIVTYGDRFHFLSQVIDACLKEGIFKIIVVDNASKKNSRSKLKELDTKEDRLKVIYLDKNTGSAGGYKRGLEEAYQSTECEYILALDDDNIIQKNALDKLENVLSYLSQHKDNLMLGMYRPIWSQDNATVKEGKIKKYNPNNFMGFNFLTFLNQSFRKKLLKDNIQNKRLNLFPLQPIEISAMGGLFFSRKVIDKLGYPKEDFFVYADDHEYTYRFTKNGGKIFLCSEIMIEDIDQTSLNDSNESIGFFHKDFSEIKMYYSIRNHTYLSKEFMTNKIFFYANLSVLSLLHFKNIFKTSFPLFMKRYKLYLKAISDGLNGHLGRNF